MKASSQIHIFCSGGLVLTAILMFFGVANVDAATTTLIGRLRDFKKSDLPGGHPDFGNTSSSTGFDPGIVEQNLGVDQKPVYAGTPTTPTTHGQSFFDQWYRDVAGVNLGVPFAVTLDDSQQPGSGIFIFSSVVNEFFPIDGELFGNDEEIDHNYHFTIEAHTEFTYSGGGYFGFASDDDLWAFIDGKLVVDLGGIHGGDDVETVLLDDLGLTIGENYSFDLFFAERRFEFSEFYINTTVAFPTLPGDYNVNGIVDAADYTTWRDSLGDTFALPNEGASPNVVDQDDYDVWKLNFGQTIPPGMGSVAGDSRASGVPEPRSCVLALCFAVLPSLHRIRCFKLGHDRAR